MDKEKKLKLMKYWLFGTFVIIFVASTVYPGRWIGLELLKVPTYWLTMGLVAALCAGAFYVYRGYLNRQS